MVLPDNSPKFKKDDLVIVECYKGYERSFEKGIIKDIIVKEIENEPSLYSYEIELTNKYFDEVHTLSTSENFIKLDSRAMRQRKVQDLLNL
jgi:hypothetical protein